MDGCFGCSHVELEPSLARKTTQHLRRLVCGEGRGGQCGSERRDLNRLRAEAGAWNFGFFTSS